MTWYVTKWWRTTGIIKGKSVPGESKYVSVRGGFHVRIGKEAFDSLDLAQADVKKRAATKAASFQKQADRCVQIANGTLIVKVAE